MWQKTPEELRAVLSAPFSSSDIEWRVSATNAEKTKGLAVPYVTNRAIQTVWMIPLGLTAGTTISVPGKMAQPSCAEFLSFSHSLNNA